MAEMSKITSFKTFTQLRAEQTEAQLAEERAAQRGELASKLTTLLDEMDITSFEELDEETTISFLQKAFGNVSEENEEEVSERNAFIYAAAKAKAEGKKEFKFNGKTYKVTLKADTGLKESEEINEGAFQAISDQEVIMTLAAALAGMTGLYNADRIADVLKKGGKKAADLIATIGKKAKVTESEVSEIEEINEDVFGDLEAAISDMEFDAYQNLAFEFGVDAEDPNMMMDFIYNELDKKGAKLLIKNINKGVYESSGLNEAIVVTGKRDAKKVMNTYIKFFEKYPALGQKAIGAPAKHHVGAVRELYAEAMIDANFSRELPATKRAIPGVVYPIDVKVAELNNALIRISAGKLMNICAENGSIISGAAKFQGLAIVEGTAMYLDSIGYTKEAEDLMARFNKAFNESTDVRVDVEAKLNEAAALVENERNEQEAMEIYTQVAGPDGKYTEPELAKADMDLYIEIVTAAGHKGSKAKKIADEFRKIATMESVLFTESEMLADYEKTLALAKKYGIPAAVAMATVAAMGVAGSIALFKKGKKSVQKWMNSKNESWVSVTEAEIKSDEEFSEYAMTVLQKAFGGDFDEVKAKEVIDGILSKVDGDYGSAVGMLTASLGE